MSFLRALPRLGRFVMHHRFPAVAVAAGMLLTCPSLLGGIAADDLFIYNTVQGMQPLDDVRFSPWEPYSYFTGDPARTLKLMDRGWIPWWTDPHCRASLARPLTALTFMLDVRLWPNHPALMHAQSMVWYGLLVFAVATLYRRLMANSSGLPDGPRHDASPAWAAGLAALLFAVDDAHALPAGWLANRNALIAAVFGCVTLIAHDSWRRKKSRAGAIFAPLALLAALLGKEEAICTLAYVSAYAMFLDTGPWRRRLAGLLPCLLAAVAWLVGYKLLGYGAFRSGGYVDPSQEPWRFLERVVTHGPILLLGQWGWPPSDAGIFWSAAVYLAHWVWALVFLFAVGCALWPMLSRDALARFWAVGMLLSVIPVCAIFSSDRLLIFVGIGAMGLLGQWLSGLVERARWVPSSASWNRLARVLGVAFFCVHLLVAPSAFPVGAASMRFVAAALGRFHDTLPAGPSVRDQTLVIVNPLGAVSDLVWIQSRIRRDVPLPERTLNLGPSCSPMELARTDARTLVVRPVGGYLRPRRWVPTGQPAPWFSVRYLAQHLDSLTRDGDHPLRLGERVELTVATIEITTLTDDGRPAEATFTFHRSLEDPSLRWLCVTSDGYAPFVPPDVGQTVAVPAPL